MAAASQSFTRRRLLGGVAAASGVLLLPGCAVLRRGAQPGPNAAGEYDVRDFGAAGDGGTNDSAAIQAAIDACAAAGGGTVRLAAGEYLSGQLDLPSGLVLQLDRDAVLYASTDARDYRGERRGILLSARRAERITITGAGTIHGQATADLGKRWGAPERVEFRTGLLLFEECREVRIRGVSFLFSDSWTVHLKRCTDVVVEGVTIRNNTRRLNSDGIDPNSCRRVRIRGCNIVTGDDSIVLKSTQAEPCEDIEISECVLESPTAALKLGTESKGDFRDVRMNDCEIRNSPVGVGLYLKDGATMERISATRIKMHICDPTHHDVAPLFIDIEKRHPDSRVGKIRDVSFTSMAIEAGTGLLLQGMPESPIENLTLRDITLDVPRADDYARRKKPVGGRRTTRDERDTVHARKPTYAAIAHVRNLTVENLQVRIAGAEFARYPRSALDAFHVQGGSIKNVTRSPVADQPPAVRLTECTGLAG